MKLIKEIIKYVEFDLKNANLVNEFGIKYTNITLDESNLKELKNIVKDYEWYKKLAIEFEKEKAARMYR